MMLDFPDVLDTEPVSQGYLVECFEQNPVLGFGVPGSRELMLVKQPELHRASSPCRVLDHLMAGGLIGACDLGSVTDGLVARPIAPARQTHSTMSPARVHAQKCLIVPYLR